MDVKPIRTEEDYDAALARIEEIWDAEPGTQESDELDVLSILVEPMKRSITPLTLRTRSKRSSFVWNRWD